MLLFQAVLAAAFADPWERAHEERQRFLDAAPRQPQAAAALLPRLIDRPWMTSLPFSDAWAVARHAAPDLGARLVRLAAAHNPLPVLRDPPSVELLHVAAMAAPVDALALGIRDPEIDWLRALPGREHFPALVDARLAASGERAAMLDRVLEHAALEHARAGIAGWRPRDVYVLLAYARPEEHEEFFAAIYDKFLGPGRLARAARDAAYLRLRTFLVTALAEGRPVHDRDLIARAIAGATTLVERTEAAELQNKPGPARLELNGPVVERQLFFNDTDGVESFESFLAAYRADPRWRIETNDGWVRVHSGSVTVYANAPVDLMKRENAGLEREAGERQQRVTAALGAVTPAIVVQRGHAYHLQRTLPFLNPRVLLVILGGCRLTRELVDVMEMAPRAQLIATRGVGTAAINDPLIKLLHEELLAAGGAVHWPSLWAKAQSRLGARAGWREYVGPHNFAAAAFLAAHFQAVVAQGY